MKVNRDEWLQTVIQAIDNVISDGEETTDPWRQLIIQDAIELRHRLKDELAAANFSDER